MQKYFNPRSPWGERQCYYKYYINETDFNPRSPWGERPVEYYKSFLGLGFQSTLSVRRATRQNWGGGELAMHFNPRSPWGERRARALKINPREPYFNPRSPWGERQVLYHNNDRFLIISIHALREESDILTPVITYISIMISIHALREESDY